MKNWFKRLLLPLIIMTVLLIAIIYFFNVRFTYASGNAKFSPGENIALAEPDSLITKPKNIIIFISDGMGFAHLSLAMVTQQAEGEPSLWEQFDVKGWHDARSSYGPLTDSGASATAMATGTSTFFEVIGMDPDGNELTNVFELASQNQYNTGIVTDSYIWDATPAAFVAHTKSRDSSRQILEQIAASELDLIFGELEDVGQEGNPELDETLEILKRRFQLLDESLELPDSETALKPISAIYEEDEVQDLDSTPNLPQLTELAIDYLTSQDAPFALLVECEELDSASHRNDSDRVLKGLQSIQKTLAMLLEFARQDGETLLLFTSDHETGGLAIVTEKNYPNSQLVWSTKDHTASVVPLFVKGPGAEIFVGIDRNWEIGERLKMLIPQNETSTNSQ